MTTHDITNSISNILKLYDIQDEECLKNTPARVSKAYSEMWRGLVEDMPKLTRFESSEKIEVVVKDIEFCSTCLHHLLPFFGNVSISYKSNGWILGLSKYSRLVQWCASRPTIQEQLAVDIKKKLEEVLDTEVSVEVTAKHSCVFARGIKDSCANAIVRV